jgi:uncharacterized membrane protein
LQHGDVMNRGTAQTLSIAWKAAIALLTLQVVAALSARYLTRSETAPEFILGNAFANPFLIIHVVSGAVALLIGPLQFVRRIRARTPAVHRAIGRIYVGACAIGAPSGLMLAIGTNAGPIAGAGFAIAGVLWPAFTYFGVRAAIEGRFQNHREWMIRAYAIVANAITLRLMLPLAGVLRFEFFAAYQVIAWLGWITNLLLAEIYLRRTRGLKMPEGRLAAA